MRSQYQAPSDTDMPVFRTILPTCTQRATTHSTCRSRIHGAYADSQIAQRPPYGVTRVINTPRPTHGHDQYRHVANPRAYAAY